MLKGCYISSKELLIVLLKVPQFTNYIANG